jgi:hypothetical protein
MAETNTAGDEAIQRNRQQKAFCECEVEHKRRLNLVISSWESWRDRAWIGDLSGSASLALPHNVAEGCM